MKTTSACSPFLLLCCLMAQTPPPAAADRMPVREVTAFKDGHAYVVRDMALPPGGNGEIVLDELPAPVLGTFWPFATGDARLVAAKSGRHVVTVEAPAIDLRQMARANVGKNITIVNLDKERIVGQLVAVPVPPAKTAPPALPYASEPPTPAETLVVMTATGTRVVPIGQVRDLEIQGEFATNVPREEQRERLTLTVAGGGAGARVGVMYVQKGLRWIPAYRLDLDGAGKAAVQLEATLVNDLIDLERATVNLVVGVPKFEFEGLVDPISLQDEMAQVAGAARGQLDFRNALANSIQTQSAGYRTDGAGEPMPAGGDAGATEDLFVFTVRDVTLRRGERLVLPIRSFALTYRDVYRLDVAFAPPVDVRQSLKSERLLELARQLAAPKARHVLRLQNGSDAPLTTAPALVLAQGQVLAQSRLTYTSKGREVDLEINPALDVRVETEEHELRRDPGPFRLGTDNYARVDVAGAITIWNGKPEPVRIEVTRRVLGRADEVTQNGTKKQLDLVQLSAGSARPEWWGWWSWPSWWFVHNGFAELRWQVELAPGAKTTLEATWQYFWR